jgi:hypothetical protein
MWPVPDRIPELAREILRKLRKTRGPYPHSGGRKKIPTPCRCGELCPSAREARDHCRKKRPGPAELIRGRRTNFYLPDGTRKLMRPARAKELNAERLAAGLEGQWLRVSPRRKYVK